MQPAQFFHEGDSQQYFPTKKYTEIENNSSESILCAPIDVNVTCSSNLNTKDLPCSLSFSLDSQGASRSEKSIIESKNIVIPIENKVKDYFNEDVVQSEANFENTNPELDDKFTNFSHVSPTSVEASKTSCLQQQEIQPTTSVINIDLENRNPLLALLQEKGHRCCELVNNPQRKNVVLVGRDINLIGRTTAKHLLDLADPPQRKILTSTLAKWATYFQRLFPKTPVSSFYAFKYEPYKRTDDIIVQRKRADGALQTQLFQERRKLIKDNRDVLLRRPLTNSTTSDGNTSSSHAAFPIKHTWRPVIRQEGENIQPRDEVPPIGNLFLHVLYY